MKKSARKKRGGVVGGSLPSVGGFDEDSQDIAIKDEDSIVISTPITPAVPTTPRQTGSLAVPGSADDVVTRMKNIELIELGKHRIKPWYVCK